MLIPISVLGLVADALGLLWFWSWDTTFDIEGSTVRTRHPETGCVTPNLRKMKCQ